MGEQQDRREAMKCAIQKVLHDFARDDSDRGIVVHYACSIEVVGKEGDTWLKHLASEGLSNWQELGMLTSAADDCRSRMRESTIDFNDSDGSL